MCCFNAPRQLINSQPMFLSIIIPVYNVEPYLRECLDSIAASSSDCWEAILVDDGSPDGCPQICDDYARRDSRFIVIHQENGGVAAARNAGLDVARGEWIWFVDSDDVVDIRQVGWMQRWLEEHKEADLVMFDLQNFSDGMSPGLTDAGAEAPMVIDECLSKNDFLTKHICYHHPRLWYRRGCVEQHQHPLRFTRGIKTGEDGEFQYKYLMLCKYPVRIVSTVYYYRHRQGSATNSIDSKAQIVKDTIKVLRNLLDFMQDNKIQMEPWLKMRLRGTMKNLLFSIYKSRQYRNNDIQNIIRAIIDSYHQKRYVAFNGILYIIAYYSIATYCLLLSLYIHIRQLE